MSWTQLAAIVTLLGWCMAPPIILIAGPPPLAGPVSIDVDEPVDPAIVARGSGSDDYFTGFEPEEGFIARDPNFPTSGFHGWLNGQPWNPNALLNWRATMICPPYPTPQYEGHVSAVHPYEGGQHLRISRYFTTNQCAFGGISCTIPASNVVIAQPIAPYTVSVELAISDQSGSTYRIQPQTNSQGVLSTSLMFDVYGGGIYVVSRDESDDLIWKPTEYPWDLTGSYQTVSIDFDPCLNRVDYYYAGKQIYTDTIHFGTALEQLLVFGDNYQISHLDIDNVSLTRGEPCQFECGNDFIEPAAGEECDGTDDAACRGHCQSDCMCGPPVGACCDTNGPDFGCVEDQPEEACSDSDEVWNLFTPCANVQCECIPQCGSRTCGGDNGCGGNCGECGDETVCNGIEFCDEETGQCRPGTPLVCSDGDACNGIEVCNHVVQGCLPGTPPICDDGLFCNGLEYCQSPFGCAPGQPPCSAAEFCDELTDECRQPIIPAASVWGLTVLALALLIGGKIHFGRKSNSPA